MALLKHSSSNSASSLAFKNSVWLFHSPFHPYPDSSHNLPISQMFYHFFQQALCFFHICTLAPCSRTLHLVLLLQGLPNDLPIVLGLLSILHGTFFTTHHMPSSKTALFPPVFLTIGLLNYKLLSFESWGRQAISC